MKERTRKNYNDFVEKNGFEPRFAYCPVTFHDGGGRLEATIKLSCDLDENDDFIFYYCCDGLNDILSLYDKDGVEDFYISGVASFGMEA